jgi:hypothetical protein
MAYLNQLITMRMKMSLAAIMTLLCVPLEESYAAPCNRTDAKLSILNKTGKTLKSVLAVHRVGKAGDDIQVRSWANLTNGARGGAVDITFIATEQGWSVEDLDWWTIYFSFEQTTGFDDKQKPIVTQTVFRLEPYNAQETLDDIRTNLQDAVKTAGPAELKAITSSNPLNPFLSPLVDPAFKLLGSLLSSKGASLAGYKPPR